MRLYPAPAAAMVMGRPPAATGAEPTTSRVVAAAAWQAWHAAAAWQPVALAPGRVAAHVPIPALSVAAPQPGALAPGRVAAHVPIPAPSVAAPQPGSTQTAADASRKQEAKRRDARERQRAHRSRVRVNASEEAAQPATLSRDVFAVEAWSEGPLPRESWSGWSESPVARVHHDRAQRGPRPRWWATRCLPGRAPPAPQRRRPPASASRSRSIHRVRASEKWLWVCNSRTSHLVLMV